MGVLFYISRQRVVNITQLLVESQIQDHVGFRFLKRIGNK